MAAASSAGVLTPPLNVIPARSWAPDRLDAWWSTYLPITLVVAVVAIWAVAPEFYVNHVLPEGFGFLELSQFVLAAAASVLCALALRFDVVKGSRLLWIAVFFFALAAFYIAGEEHSWGQHFFNWNTPAYWSEINRQQETNLHNTSPWFNQRPKLLFDNAMFIGGLLIPFVQQWTGTFRQPLLALLTPPLAIAPAALIALSFKVVDDLGKDVLGTPLFTRPSEVVETFQYLYMFYYVLVLRRRLLALDAAGVKRVTL
ncbi:hypothetical protein [Hyphomicrobium sp. DMF-1]|jgi:hypothetical protein|uniref:hypothetical protein n=1 Tax=Hyphomicrobium sp. DMF-1 TaxID=3019544 RepID=UPI0022EBB084|nr:hypothetical protein [Hyphomicrobium sp. DMF-1]WBT40004.1 hypothetical protein PE058_09020 [Hyphomicrobium sp. DMF-1]